MGSGLLEMEIARPFRGTVFLASEHCCFVTIPKIMSNVEEVCMHGFLFVNIHLQDVLRCLK